MVYVSLLRGINVGGNNKVNMKQLKAAFEQAGMQHVVTYINSGNVIFADTTHTPTELVVILEKLIVENFGFEIKVLLRDIDAMRDIVRALPDTWQNDSEMRSDVMFLWEAAASPNIINQLALNEGVDTVKYAGGSLLWSVPRSMVTKSAMLKVVGTPLYKQMTIRNCNTTRKLLEIMEASPVLGARNITRK